MTWFPGERHVSMRLLAEPATRQFYAILSIPLLLNIAQ
jgi:hypothetical protein